jgi:predicted nucleic acid-binding protein
VPKGFIDTNVLVYQLDKRDLDKRNTCRGIVRDLVGRNDAVISTQVLQEFYVICTTKLKLKPVFVKGLIHGFENMEVVTIGTELIKEAIDASVQNDVSFWDSLIIVSAEAARCKYLYTEDLNDGQIIRNVRIQNPFK